MVMPFLRLVLIYVFVAAAAVVFFNRDEILPMVGWPWFAGDAVAAADTDTADYSDDNDDADADADGHADEETDEAASAASSEMATTPQAQTIQTPVANPAPAATETATAAADPAPTTPPAATSAATPTPSSQAAADLDAMRTEARQAYWNGDLAKTEKLYKAMAAANPTNVDILGELGNLYFSQRRFDDAGTYYHLAAKQLITEGKTQQAMPLISVLQNIAPDKANELRTLAAKP